MGINISIPAPVTFDWFGIPIYSTVIAAWLAMAVLIIVSWLATRNMQLVPSGLQNVVEYAVESLLSLCEQVAGEQGRKLLPLAGTLFLFILVANWMGILPLWGESDWLTPHHGAAATAAQDASHAAPADAHGAAADTHGETGGVPWTVSREAPLRSANSDINLTLAMAVVVALWTQVTRIRSSGIGGWVKHLTLGPPPLLELISEISRPISLALRLFGNILAGGVLVLVMSTLVPTGLVVPIVFMAFELFVGIVQALIFTSLTIAFLTLAAAGHGDEHGAEAHRGAERAVAAH